MKSLLKPPAPRRARTTATGTAAHAAPPPPDLAAPRPHTSFLRPLGVVGYDPVEPALLAALATEEPLLLVSDHGAAKTMLLVRLADALGVELRHYNASLLQFDDLAGFPVPDEHGGIRYAAPAGAIWGAEAVFIDEIGRCRPETANKLFPVVHERRIQGIALDRLRFRWAATNPPPEARDEESSLAFGYEGVEALDAALADRFAYVVPLPRFADLSDDDRRLVVRGVGDLPEPGAALRARELVAATRAMIPGVLADVGDAAADYALAVLSRLASAGVATGGRRAATLHRNIVAVRAACVALGRRGDESACAAALLASIPDVARRRVPRATILAAHAAAWQETGLPDTDPRRLLLAVRDPMRRAVLALTLPDLGAALRGEALGGALAELPRHESEILAWQLLPRVIESEGSVPATAIEAVAETVGSVAVGGHVVRGFGTQAAWAVELREALAESSVPARELEYLHGALVRAFAAPESVTGFDPKLGVRGLVRRALAFRARCLAALGAAPAAKGVP